MDAKSCKPSRITAFQRKQRWKQHESNDDNNGESNARTSCEHRELQCLVAFELKIDEFEPSYLGQLEFYLEALDRDVKKEHENPSIGVLLCRKKNDEVVKYALSRSLSPTVISEYETKLIPKELLRKKLNEFYERLEIKE